MWTITERKNQSYIFDIAKRLEEYKISFHFIGNQADNLKVIGNLY
jgi:hypothetical protein